MGLIISPTLIEARDLLRERRYDEALQALARVDEEALSGLELGVYYTVKGELLILTGDYAHEFLDRAIQIFKNSDENWYFAHAKFLKGWQLQACGEPLKAKEPLIESYTAFLRIDDYNSAAQALNRLAMISFHSGDTRQTVQNLQQAITCCDRSGNARLKNSLRINISLVYFLSGAVTEAIHSYDDARRVYETYDPKNKCVLNLGYAMAIGLTGDIVRAKRILSETRDLLAGFRREEALYQEYLGWISTLDGDHEGAEEALLEGLKVSLEIAPESTLVSQTKRLLGDLYLATAEYNKAEKYANEALAAAEKLNERVEIAACYRIFAQLDCLNGKKTQAREWYKKAKDLFNLIESRYELAVTRYLAARSGLYDHGERTALLYLAKEYFESENIKHYIDKVQQELNAPVQTLRPRSARTTGSPTIIAGTPIMKKILSLAENVASSDMTVLLTGETGTGKDLLADFIHYHSGRKGEFVTVNAAAIPTAMVESELFGHAKGAFTGADKDKAGLFEMADNGTFYLNEVADTTPEFQAKLLEVLETRQVRRLGENKRRQVGFRLIAATNHDLNQRMRDGYFRCDLYHRLNEIPIHLPPLSKRTEDIPALVNYFLSQMGLDVGRKEHREALRRLSMILGQRSWSGNVRELLAHVKYLHMASGGNAAKMIDLALGDGSREECDKLIDLLNLTGWNRSTAAMILGVTEGTIRSRIRKYNLKS